MALYVTDLRRHVIEKARRQIAEHTDIAFTYRVEREGRSAESLRFFVQQSDGETEEKQRLRSQADVDADTGSESDLRFDVRTWFLKGLSQEEVRSIDGDEVEALHEAARQEAERQNPEAKKSVLAYETLRRMEKKWGERSEE
ncbi:MAG: hypothetical protein ABEK75_12770 [Salinibacter sp.]